MTLNSDKSAGCGDALGIRYVLVLWLLPILVYATSVQGTWLTWDDVENFVHNPNFRGIGIESLRWAWSHSRLGVYQPFSWMLFSVEWNLFGSSVHGYHVVSLLLHAMNGVLLAKLSLDLLARARPAAVPLNPTHLRLAATLGALLFALHPLRTEVVAWVSAQPYLLCSGFVLQATRMHVASSEETAPPRRSRYRLLTFAFYLAAALSKAPALGLPIVFLLIDRLPWRVAPRPLHRLSVRMWGLYFLSAVGGALIAGVVRTHQSPGPSLESVPLLQRATAAAYSLCFYVWKSLQPVGLRPHYPRSLGLLTAENFLPGVCLIAVALAVAAAFLYRKRAPSVAIAVGAYVVFLSPNLGLAHVGTHVAADRYSYLASLGWVVVLSGWFAGFLHSGMKVIPVARVVIAVAVVLASTALSFRQAQTWRSDLALWRYALAEGRDVSAVALQYLGIAQAEDGQQEAAIISFRRALQIKPEYADPRANLAALLLLRGDEPEGLLQLNQALELQPTHRIALQNLGIYYLRTGHLQPAITALSAAVQTDSSNPRLRLLLANALFEHGDLEASRQEALEALRIEPRLPGADLLLNELSATQDGINGTR